MQNDEGGGVGQNVHEECSAPCSNLDPNHGLEDVSPSPSEVRQVGGGTGAISQARRVGGSVHLPTLSIAISHPKDIPGPNMSISKNGVSEGDEQMSAATSGSASMKVFLPRSESYKDQCRVCQQQSEEPLIDLGCRCRGELAKVHRSCIEMWFHTKGSNKCEICQQVASNVPFPEPQPSGCLNPLWVAFALLIGGLFLDVLISISLGISSLPVNVITGVLIVLGLAAALRLSLECCQELGARRNIQTDGTINPGYHPAV